jgi:DnaJ-domain-containing protein 1
LIYLTAAGAILAFFIFGSKGGKPRRPAPPGPASSEPMSLGEARAILGVGPEATAAEIRTAYARLMRRAHPDLGGAHGAAAELNAARDRLNRS